MKHFITQSYEAYGDKTRLFYLLVSWDGETMLVLKQENRVCSNMVEEIEFNTLVANLKERYKAIELY